MGGMPWGGHFRLKIQVLEAHLLFLCCSLLSLDLPAPEVPLSGLLSEQIRQLLLGQTDPVTVLLDLALVQLFVLCDAP